MAEVNATLIEEYLRLHSIPGLAEPFTIQQRASFAGEQRFRVSSSGASASSSPQGTQASDSIGAIILKRYEPGAIESARREGAGQRLGGEMGLAAPLLLFDEDGGALGGPVIVYQEPAGKPLGRGPLTEQQVDGWLFLLLTLHHLRPDAVSVASSMSADPTIWWRRTQAAWDACQSAYGGAQYQQLIQALTRLHAIVTARIEAHRDLWATVIRRPCHGNPVPAHLTQDGARMTLTEWEGFGLGDPAMEVGRAAALAALSGELSADQYVRFISDYLAGVQDQRDATFAERVRIFASVLPLGFGFVVLSMLGSMGGALTGATAAMVAVRPDERARDINQVKRALTWVQDTLGVEVGDPQVLLANVR